MKEKRDVPKSLSKEKFGENLNRDVNLFPGAKIFEPRLQSRVTVRYIRTVIQKLQKEM